MEGEREKYIDLGLDDYMSKPITFNKLIGVLAKWFDIEKLDMKSNNRIAQSKRFLLDETKISENSNLMGGRNFFLKFIKIIND